MNSGSNDDRDPRRQMMRLVFGMIPQEMLNEVLDQTLTDFANVYQEKGRLGDFAQTMVSFISAVIAHAPRNERFVENVVEIFGINIVEHARHCSQHEDDEETWTREKIVEEIHSAADRIAAMQPPATSDAENETAARAAARFLHDVLPRRPT